MDMDTVEGESNQTDLFGDNLDKNCRLCGNQSGAIMHNIFDNEKDILEKISFCLPIVVLPHDPNPKQICDKCNGILDVAFRFISKSIVVDKRFRQVNDCTRNVNVNALELEGPVKCDVCKLVFTDMTLFDQHTQQHKDEMFHYSPSDRYLEINKKNGSPFKKTDTRNFSSKKSSFSKSKSDNPQVKKKDSPVQNISLSGSKIHIRRELISAMVNNASKSCQENDLSNEEQITSEKKPLKKEFICNICNSNFPNHKKLKAHSIEIHNSTLNSDWICKFCNKSLTTKVGLIIHERIHDGSKPYICEWCGNGFRSRANLTQHQLIHTGVRKYPCPRCNKKFARRSFVRTHMRTHTGERPYCCDDCGYRFTQIGDMKRHRNRHRTYPQTFNSPNITTE